VWYYKINDEARRYLRDGSISPGIALLAVTLGALIIVPPFVSVYRTGERIQRMQQKAGGTATISPTIGLLTSFLFALHHVYLQEQINRVWASKTPTVVPSPV
jgi:ABC-type spermidine/putrescine transport system permease subunit II